MADSTEVDGGAPAADAGPPGRRVDAERSGGANDPLAGDAAGAGGGPGATDAPDAPVPADETLETATISLAALLGVEIEEATVESPPAAPEPAPRRRRGPPYPVPFYLRPDFVLGGAKRHLRWRRRPLDPGVTRERRRRNGRAYEQRRRDAGQCRRCDRFTGGRSLCDEHLARELARQREKRAAARRALERKEAHRRRTRLWYGATLEEQRRGMREQKRRSRAKLKAERGFADWAHRPRDEGSSE